MTKLIYAHITLLCSCSASAAYEMMTQLQEQVAAAQREVGWVTPWDSRHNYHLFSPVLSTYVHSSPYMFRHGEPPGWVLNEVVIECTL